MSNTAGGIVNNLGADPTPTRSQRAGARARGAAECVHRSAAGVPPLRRCTSFAPPNYTSEGRAKRWAFTTSGHVVAFVPRCGGFIGKRLIVSRVVRRCTANSSRCLFAVRCQRIVRERLQASAVCRTCLLRGARTLRSVRVVGALAGRGCTLSQSKIETWS